MSFDDGPRDGFVAALDAPVELNPTVKARYARRSQWDRQERGGPSRAATIRS